MAETTALTDSRRSCFFLYDSSKVQEEGDPTRKGIYYFYPEDTPIDQQELLCGQLAGVCRCVSELSSSPVRLLRLRKSKYAVRMKDKFIWVLDELISLFCFYNGPVRQSYQLYSKEELALRWAEYLSHLQGGSTELHKIFSCLRTIDSTHIDPLLLLKAALILQACQRCPLVLAGCILYRGRVVSTQMPPALTVKVMVYETQTYSQENRIPANSRPCVDLPASVTETTQVYLTSTELHTLRSSPVERACRSHCSQAPSQVHKSRLLSRTLSDTPTSDTDSSNFETPQCPPTSYQTTPSSPRSSFSDEPFFSPSPLLTTPNQSVFFAPECPNLSNGTCVSALKEGSPAGSLTSLNRKHETNMNSECESKSGGLSSDQEAQKDRVKPLLNGLNGLSISGGAQPPEVIKNKWGATGHVTSKTGILSREKEEDSRSKQVVPKSNPLNETLKDASLVPLGLYQHRVRGLVLALLVESEFRTDASAREEVQHSSLGSLNGLEAHLRNSSPGTLGPPGTYTFAHYDVIQNTLTSNISVRSSGPQDHNFVKATALLHSHFSDLDTLQEVIIRSAGSAVYATRSTAQETFFLQQGAAVRNSGSPDPQDSAFSLPKRARQRLLKHGVNLL
ncbi:hypothetical protein DNTS_015213 [Danionella cerebrum]|uniref:CCZ1/INTU/HSP4 first Longin domain-containing protein n=1 Tax=Danionella cerebrum TaxID=2873325 RepID=A0A553NJL1_9TELE|nr:hypothetical protein DNTS_015213 [Danionella translucida]TRY65610.1 hypothetical protein DNTS_015213 [Danionella translucida]